MTGIGLLLLFALVRTYYRRKWEGSHTGDPLDLSWIRRRIDCSEIERCGQIVNCYYENPRLVFLVQSAETLEWHFRQHTMSRGWIKD